MLTYEIHLIICDDIHDIDLDCKCFRIIPKDLLILILFHKNKRLICYTYFYMIILQNSPFIIAMNLYMLSIQKAPFISVAMLTHYKCEEKFISKPNIYRWWTIPIGT